MKKKKNFTFSDVIYHLNKANDYENEYWLDYFSSHCEEEPKPYDEYYGIVRYGSSEGIYADFYAQREGRGETIYIGCAKTLCDSGSAFIKMHELVAKVALKMMMVAYD